MTSMKLMEMDSSVSISDLLSNTSSNTSKKKININPKIKNEESTDNNASNISNVSSKNKNIIIEDKDKEGSIKEKNIVEKNIDFDKIKNEWNNFILMISKKRPSIGTALEHGVPTALIGNKLTVEISGLPEFSVGNLNRNSQVIEEFFNDYYNYNLKINAIMSESVEKSSISETSTNDNIAIKNQLKSNETI